MAEASGPARAQRLTGRTSAYLRSATEQPIDWHPWGPEPFELARRTHRPVLLDIGASWCHWCHVMDEGTYVDAEVAVLLAEHFVAVKVDRDENPEVDRRYQRQVGALTGEGGWPLTAFLTPDGEVFLGGTYFPPTDGHGRPGFRRVLREVARLWREEPERIRETAQAVQAGLARMRAARATGAGGVPEFVGQVLSELQSGYDPVHAGFGMAPKFPHPTATALFLWDGHANGRSLSTERAAETLRRMADGGLYDQVGGGFHRYSVDEGWHIPHFEKMGVDNAALLASYVDGVRCVADPRFEEIVRGTADWVRTTLGDPAGGFGASQDADNAPGDDGGYFTWTRAEIKDALSADEARFALRFFGVGTDGRMPHDTERNVLFRLVPAAEAAAGLELKGGPEAALARVVERLRAVRSQRPTPAVDRALYADINGRFVAGLANAGAVLDEPVLVAEARRAADRFLRHAYAPDVGVAHRLEGNEGLGHGLLEDQVGFATGLLELGGVTADPRYAQAALQLLTLVDREYRGEDGLLRDLAPRLYDGPELGALKDPSYPVEDSPHLAANSGAAIAFLRLASLTHDDAWRTRATELLPPLARRLGHAGIFGAGAALAAGLASQEAATVIVEGSGPTAAALLRAARRSWHPNVWVFGGTPPPPYALPESVAAPSGGRGVRALVCFGNACAPPVTEPGALRSLLERGSAAPAA